MTVAEAAAAIVTECLDHLAAYEGLAATGADSEGVHQLRVAVRRLRSALGLFSAFVPELVRTTLDGELEWFARALAPARELDVFLNEVLPAAEASVAVGEPSLTAVAAHARRQRAAAYAWVVDILESERYQALKDAIEQLRSGAFSRAPGGTERAKHLEEPTVDWAARVLGRLHVRALKRGRRFRKLDPAGRHKVRVAAKRLRYAAEFFGDLYRRKAARRYTDRMRPLQQELGRMNDLATLNRLLDRVALSAHDAATASDVEALRRWSEREYAALEPGLVADWRRFKRAKPFWSNGKR